jgi:hypothetical protein
LEVKKDMVLPGTGIALPVVEAVFLGWVQEIL